MSYIFRALLLSEIALGFSGCTQPVATDVPGHYRADYAGGQDELDLRADGTYRHALGTGEIEQVDTGTWMVETLRGETVGISLDNFRFRDRRKQMEPPGVWHVEVETEAFSGHYKLCFDPDQNSCFVKL